MSAVYDLLERLLPGSSSHFTFSVVPGTSGFALTDLSPGLAVSGETVADVAAGLGYYLREMCGMTIGWVRGGGSNVFLPSPSWPTVASSTVPSSPTLSVPRTVPVTWVANVCTSSYTWVWYAWADGPGGVGWERTLDWMALSGVNAFYALMGQEEALYEVLSSPPYSLTDLSIRDWFNGPSFLTWSRGQNGHGAGIAGPLPRSYMRNQLALAQQVVQRALDFDMLPALPGFQGNVPYALAAATGDKNITDQGNQTGWLDSRDPLFAALADAYMGKLCGALGEGACAAGSWWQMDGYFANGTTWGQEKEPSRTTTASSSSTAGAAATPNCTWSGPFNDTYLAGCSLNCQEFDTLEEAQQACVAEITCAGVTIERGRPQLRAGSSPIHYANETSYLIADPLLCKTVGPDPDWLARGKAAYAGLTRTVSNATWLYQGWALYVAGSGFTNRDAAGLSRLRGFIDAAPSGRFVILDMSTDGSGQWSEWDGSWNAPFVWTALHTFGGGDSLQGNLSRTNRIPFDALPGQPSSPSVGPIGVGYTPEGLDQNPAVYELLQEASYRPAALDDIPAWLVRRAHRRYGIPLPFQGQVPPSRINPYVDAAWRNLSASSYSVELGVGDSTGVGLFPGSDSLHFDKDRRTPTPLMCGIWVAWGNMLRAATAPDSSPPINQTAAPFRYDLVDVGREVMAQLTVPVSQNFSDAVRAAAPLNAALVNATGQAYIDLLLDLDALVSTEPAFLLGPWLDAAASLAEAGDDDCGGTLVGDLDCPTFMKWNARVQITTWYPTAANATEVYPRDTDCECVWGAGGWCGKDRNIALIPPVGRSQHFPTPLLTHADARKHWSGLISGYYARRASLVLGQGLSDAAQGHALNTTALALQEAKLAYNFSLSGDGPHTPNPGFVDVSAAMRQKYAVWFVDTCGPV